MVTSVLSAIVVLGLLIFVHELGHFLACKRVGVGVLKFSLGFGPVLFSRRYGDTDYCLSAIPLGGYVKMIGQEDDGSEPDPVLAAQPNSFAVKPLWARALIVVAGPLGNLIFAALLLSIGGTFKRYFPNVLRVLADGPVGGEPRHSCDVEHTRARPIGGRQPQPFDASLRCAIGIEVRCHHVVVGMPQRVHKHSESINVVG